MGVSKTEVEDSVRRKKLFFKYKQKNQTREGSLKSPGFWKTKRKKKKIKFTEEKKGKVKF